MAMVLKSQQGPRRWWSAGARWCQTFASARCPWTTFEAPPTDEIPPMTPTQRKHARSLSLEGRSSNTISHNASHKINSRF